MGNNKVVDWRKIRTGKNGQFFVDIGDNRYFLGECDTFRIYTTNNNTDYQPVGSDIVYAIPTGHTVGVTMTETVIRDDLIISDYLAALNSDKYPEYGFVGKLNGADGTTSQIRVTCCVPDGDTDLINITPGEIVKRAWTFRGNANPDVLEKLGVTS